MGIVCSSLKTVSSNTMHKDSVISSLADAKVTSVAWNMQRVEVRSWVMATWIVRNIEREEAFACIWTEFIVIFPAVRECVALSLARVVFC